MINNSGKAYANVKKKDQKPKGDFYQTPRSLVWVMESLIRSEFLPTKEILEPCSGDGAISQELQKMGFMVHENDLYREGVDYLSQRFDHQYIITNPPFSMWDQFVKKAKAETEKCMFIGRLNYFGTTSRTSNGMWKNLKSVHCFNRYVDYRTLPRNDGFFNIGAMATGWFLWDRNYNGDPTLHFVDIQPYAKLGLFKEY